MNILTIDVEEWFHLLDNDSTRSESQWEKFEVRIYDNVERLLSILEDTDTQATFFIIGWIAKTYPDLVRRIAARYQVASHTMSHQLVWQQTPSEFRADVEASLKLLEDITGNKITAFRAPGFSIRESEGWALEILSELGVTVDCSVFPSHHAHGGMPSYKKAVPSLIEYKGIRMRELPVCAKLIAGRPCIFSGGGYFRLFPYPLIRYWARQMPDYLMTYIHPRDLDPGQPVIKDLSATRHFKSYYGLKGAEQKLRQFLTDFKFIDIAQAEIEIDWKQAPIVKIG